MISWVITAILITGILSAIHAVMDARTSQGAVAWAVSLVTMPIVAVPAYWIFGRTRFEGYNTARQGKLSKISEMKDVVFAATKSHQLPKSVITSAGLAAEQLALAPFLSGNQVELLINGKATFDSIVAGIEQAKHYVLIQFFIVKDDGIGQRIQNCLRQKAESGVPVYFLFDEIGCIDLPQKYIDDLRAAGVNIRPFNTTKGPRNRFQLNFRNHRKIVVVDGHTAWIGGHNIGDEYLGKSRKFADWRDTHIRFYGPATLVTQLSFLEDWYWATDDLLKLEWESAAATDSNIPMLILPSGPADMFETANLMFVHAIHSAKERIWIASPYFVPDPPVIAALQLAGLRGLDIRILIPDQPDHFMVWLASYAYFETVERAGVQFFRYTKGFTHQKTLLIDQNLAAIGTANVDNRSFRLNFEITALIADDAFAKQIETMLEEDFSNAEYMRPGAYSRKPWWFRFGVKLARLTAPVQ